MKKLLVTDADMIDPKVVQQVEEFLALQMSYGLVDFSPEKILDQIAQHFKLKLSGVDHPEFYLTDAAGGVLTLTFKEEYLGY